MDEILEKLEGLKSVVMPFGKHKGDTLADIYDENKGYLKWLAGQDGLNSELCGLFMAYMEMS